MTNSIIKIDDFGTAPNLGASHDSTPAFNSAISYAKNNASTVKTILFSGGSYYFNSRPTFITHAIELAGFGRGRTYLYRNYYASFPADALVRINPHTNGSIVRDLGIVATANSSGGSAISIASLANEPPTSFLTFKNLFLSSDANNRWYNTVNVDGTGRTTAPRGVRDTGFVNCSVFGAQNSAMELQDVVAFNFNGGGIFSAGGSTGRVILTGGMGSQGVAIQTSHLAGTSVGNATGYRIEGT